MLRAWKVGLAAKALFEEEHKPDALIIDSHNLTIGVIMELRKMGLKIPEDVGIIGYGENPSVEVINPGITTIVQPEEEIAKVSYALLKEQMESDGKLVNKKVELESEIVVRGSC